MLPKERDNMNENKTIQAACASCGSVEELVCINHYGLRIWICPDCARNAGYRPCAECGSWHLYDRMLMLGDSSGDYVCENCSVDSNKFFRCMDCGRLYHRESTEAVIVNRNTWRQRTVCEHCATSGSYFQCDHCGGYFSGGQSVSDNTGACLCNSCFVDLEMVWCDSCQRMISRSEAEQDPETCRWYCAGEHFENRPRRYIHDYGYKPEPKFLTRPGDADDSLFFGVELEIDDGNDSNEVGRALVESGEKIYLKHDGSLGDEGVEIVTHPGTLAYHQYGMRWAEICRISRSHGYHSHNTNTCGLHIHVGRKQLGNDRTERETAAANMVILTRKLWEPLVNFTRRDESKLDEWAACPDLDIWDYDDEHALLVDALDTVSDGRYQAVNLNNRNTVEFRIFKGTLRRDTIIASIQLVSNLTKYAMTHTPMECRAASWADVIGFESHDELNTYCQGRGL